MFVSPPVPMWAIGAIVVVVLALVACLGFCIWKKCINKGKKPKKVRERKGGRGRRKKEGAGEGEEGKVRGDGGREGNIVGGVMGSSTSFATGFEVI